MGKGEKDHENRFAFRGFCGMWAVFVASIFSGGTCWAAAREAKSGAPPGKVEGGASHRAFQWISRDGRGPRDGDAEMIKIRCEQDFFMDHSPYPLVN